MLYINGDVWNIKFVSPTSSILINNDGYYTLGVTVPEWRTIYIANNIYGKKLKNVIAHEITHAEFCSRGLYVPIYIEEVLCDIIADNITDTYINTNLMCNCCGKC